MKPVVIALVGVNSPNYYAREYHVYDTCAGQLKAMTSAMAFELRTYPLIATAEEADTVRDQAVAEEVDYLLIVTAGFATGDIMLRLSEANLPLGVWAVPEPTSQGDIRLHSLVTANLFASIAHKCLQRKMKWFYGNADDLSFQDRFAVTLAAVRCRKALQGASIGILGSTAPTFYNLEEPQAAYGERFGLKFTPLSMDELERDVHSLTQQDVQSMAARIRASVSECVEDEGALQQTARVYLALSQTVRQKNIRALAAACWPDFQERFGITPCVAFSLIGDELGVPVACEGDLGGTVTLLLLNAVSGAMPALMDLTAVDMQEDQLLLWHCGIGSAALAGQSACRIIHHPMMNRKDASAPKVGLSYDYVFQASKATVARLSHSASRLFAFSGTFDGEPSGYAGTRGMLQDLRACGKPVSVRDVLETVFSTGTEHHLAVCGADCEAALREFGSMSGIPAQPMMEYQPNLQQGDNP